MDTPKSSDFKIFIALTLSIFFAFVFSLATVFIIFRSKNIPVKSSLVKNPFFTIIKELGKGNIEFNYNSSKPSSSGTTIYKYSITSPPVNINYQDTNKDEVNLGEDYLNTAEEPSEEACIQYKISYPDEFISDKCYNQSDYSNLISYYYSYVAAKSNKEYAERGIKITCDNQDFFGDSCDSYKKTLAQATDNINKYRALILELISHGK